MQVRFAAPTPFARDLRQRVNAYLATQDARQLRRRMLTKTAVVVAWTAVSYVGMLSVSSPWLAALFATSLGLAIAAIGMNIQHDANHNAYPVGPRARRALGFSLDLVGASSYIWHHQHNLNHHPYTNVAGADQDIDFGSLARIAPSQSRRWYHRWQFLYLWPAYSLLVVRWFLWADWRDLITGRIGEDRFPPPRGRELLWLILGKVGAAAFWVGIPLVFHPIARVLLLDLLALLITGFVLAVVFQLAHVVEIVAFPTPSGNPAHSANDWARHQLATTADYAPENRALRWYVGGLNFQVEHHLFPQVCHLHYPAVARIVADLCREYGIPYHQHETVFGALSSHARLLRRMGQPVAVTNRCPPSRDSCELS